MGSTVDMAVETVANKDVARMGTCSLKITEDPWSQLDAFGVATKSWLFRKLSMALNSG